MSKYITLFASLVLVVALSACSDNNLVNSDPMADKARNKKATAVSDDMSLQATTTEGFESGSKTSYAAGTVTLGTGSYTLTEALIGNSTSDRKNGFQSARIRETGRVTMNFNRTTGAGTVTVRHAVFGTDGASSFELWMSTNSGASWTRVGSAVTVSSTSLQTATFTVNVGGTVRFEIRKVSGGANRINIDDIVITDGTGGTTPPPPTGGNEIEPNNTTAQAQAVTAPATIVGFISSTSDVDYFRVNATAGQTIALNMTVPSSVDYDLYLLNSSGALLRGSENGTGASESISFVATYTGTHFVQVMRYSGSSTTASYSLSINVSGSTGGGTTPPPPTSSNEHMVMGNPDGAIASTTSPAKYLMEKPQYALSYNRDKGIPNWVSWRVDASWIGSAPRQDDFRADNTLPAGWYQVGGSSYSGSGFDRGHNCPSADRTNSVANNSATFLMTNMIPQAPDNNQGPWASLENYTRTLVNQGNECYVIMGQYGVGGTGSNGSRTSIDGGRVTVPARTWKVIVVLPVGSGDDAARVTTATRVIAVDMPNAQGIRSQSWGNYRTTVDAIEQAAGVDMMSRVSASVQAVIESRVDNGPVQ